jgi:hypothetical protein
MTARKRRNHFSLRHPLAGVARRRCDDEHGLAGNALIGGVACGECWERAIRDDERVAVEHELPRELAVDAALVDEIAVDRACRGERIRLTGIERAVAAARLTASGLSARAVAGRLRIPVARLAVLVDRCHAVRASAPVRREVAA